jgi:tRNA dimethylallyltransferase
MSQADCPPSRSPGVPLTYGDMPWILIYGPTGSGKSELAIQIAKELGGLKKRPLRGAQSDSNFKIPCAILSCDSVAVYKHFDIGAAKPSPAERCGIDHFLLDLVSWDDPFDAGSYASHGREVMKKLWKEGVLPVVVAGTGLYLRALQGERFDQVVGSNVTLRTELQTLSSEALWQRLFELRPQRAKEIHTNDRVRLIRGIELALSPGDQEDYGTDRIETNTWPKPLWTVALDPPRSVLHGRISLRAEKMLEQGLEQEVQSLLDAGVDPLSKPMQSIGYKQMCEVLLGKMPRENLAERIKAATRQYAKRQCTWFKKLPRDITVTHSDQVLLDPLLAQLVR